MVTLLHTADTHVGYRQYHRPEREADFRDAFYQVIDEAIEREVDAVVHAGDLFNSSRPGIEALSDALEGLKRLDRANIPFLSIVGNHDGTRDRQWLDVFASLGLAVRLDGSGFSIQSERGGGCHLALYGLDHVEPGRRDRLDYAFDREAATEADASVLVAHGLFKPFPNGDWDARAICRQSSVEFDAILAGDDHTNQETVLTEFDTLLTYPGSTERTAADQRDRRGFDLVEVSPEGEIDLDFQTLDTRKFVYVDVELEDGEGLNRVLETLDDREAAEVTEEREAVEGEDATRAGFEGTVVVVTLTGAGERVSSGPVEERGLAGGALTVRVNDRREWSDELREYGEVAFADPERAVEKRRRTLGLSENGRAVEKVIRDTEAVPESNVTDVVESRVREWLDDQSIGTFERTEPETIDESSVDQADGTDEDEGPTGTVPDADRKGKHASEEPAVGAAASGGKKDEGEREPATESIAIDSEDERASEAKTGTRTANGANGASSSEPEPSEGKDPTEKGRTVETADSVEAEEPDTPGDGTDGRTLDEAEKSEPSGGDEGEDENRDERTTQATLWD